MAGKPNFFIVGAPKSGTTALYEYLRGHPNVFMPTLKEPHFFSTDLITYHLVKTQEEYLALFADSTPAHRRIGEASASYLRSAAAIRNIHDFDPNAKLIAMFRNPVELVHSFHSQLLYWSEEVIEDFEAAWHLQDRRRQGLDIPRKSREPFWLQYAELGRFGTQAERMLSVFPAAQVKLILYDDFAASPRKVYEEVLAFLDLPSDQRTEFPRVNENKRAKVAWVRNFMRKPPPALRNAYRRLKRAVGEQRVVPLVDKLLALNTAKERRRPLSPAFRAELVATFRDEVAHLSRIMHRDLRHWM